MHSLTWNELQYLRKERNYYDLKKKFLELTHKVFAKDYSLQFQLRVKFFQNILQQYF